MKKVISILALYLLLVSCTKTSKQVPKAPKWPTFPKTKKQIQALLKRYPVPKGSITDPPMGLTLYPKILKDYRTLLSVGWPQITKELQKAFVPSKTSYLLWGTTHDSRQQFTTFSRLLGGTGLTGVTDVIIEMLYATGHWSDIPSTQQQGESHILHAIASTGSSSALRSLHQSQKEKNYAGWKYNYLDAILDLTLVGRGRGFKVHGCELPKPLRKMLKYGDSLRLRVREYHCAQANQLFRKDKRQIAMFWGRSHIEPQGIRRFLPADARVTAVYVYGMASSPSTFEYEFERKVKILQPTLIKLKASPHMRRYALLLPGLLRYKQWMQTRTKTQKATAYNLQIDGSFHAFDIAGKQYKKTTQLKLSPGDHTFLLQRKPSSHMLIGNVRILQKGFTRIRVFKTLRLEYHHKSP